MRATLLHNPKAGTAEDEDRLVDAFRKIGWTVDRCVPKDDLEDCFCHAHSTDVIIVAGGDGTIGKLAKRLVGTEIPIAIVPTGTANNVARSLGIGVDPGVAVRGLGRAVERRLDLGRARSGRTATYFIEGFGVGVFAHVLGEKASKKHKKLRKALGLIAHELAAYEAGHYEIEVDGKDRTGHYLLAAAMNLCSFGPALGLAPHAEWDDGALDLVLVKPEQKEALVAHLRRAAAQGDIALPAFETMSARTLRVSGEGRWAHVDDVARELDGDVELDVMHGAVRVLVPAP